MATVLSAHAWEADFVAHARRTGFVRVVARAFEPIDVERARPDIVIVGEETPWLDADVVGLWLALGTATVLVGGAGGLDDCPVRCADPDVESIAAQVRGAWLAPPPRESDTLISVVGASGSGVTEIACAVASAMAPSHVVDRDPPSVALRLVLDLDRPGRGPITVSSEFPLDRPAVTVLDGGNRSPPPEGRCLLVVAQTPVSFVRAARLIVAWSGPVPDLIVNMVRDPQHAEEFALTTLGLEPRLLLEYDPAIAEHAVRGATPPSWFSDRIGELVSAGDARSHP